MNAAFCSCRQTTVLILESNNVSKTLSIFAPGMPKMYSTPCASKLLTSRSAPVCGTVVDFIAGALIVFSFGLRKIFGWVPPQVCLQEILRFRQSDVVVTLALDLEAQIRPAALQNMTSACSVIRNEVQMTAGSVEECCRDNGRYLF